MKLAEEMLDVLNALADTDAVLRHPTFRKLIGATAGSPLAEEIENLLARHMKTPRQDIQSVCMCGTYHRCLERFGEFTRASQDLSFDARCSSVASELLMVSRGLLAFYTDTVSI